MLQAKQSSKLCRIFSLDLAAAEAVTRRDRYLMIGTSGGLNQQRTGVSCLPYFSLQNLFQRQQILFAYRVSFLV